MITIPTVEGKLYAVSATTTCTVTSESGTVIGTAEPGTQFFFQAQKGITTTLSDDAAEYSAATFNRAPYQKLRLLGVVGGVQLPAGYTQVAFLESTGAQYCGTDFYPDSDSAISFDFNPVYSPSNLSIWCFSNADADRTEAGRSFKYGYPGYAEFGNLNWVKLSTPPKGERQIFCMENGRLATGLEEIFFDKITFADGPELTLFRNVRDTTITNIRIYQTVLYQAGEKVRNFVAAVDPNGRPCKFDLVTQTPQYNRVGGADFVVGIARRAQLKRMLANLPEGGGTLTISLPSDVVDENGVLQDMAIFTALSAAAAKGWSFIIQTHDGTAVETAVPAGYMECEFLESTGEQYINIGYNLSNDSAIQCVYKPFFIGVSSGLFGNYKAPMLAFFVGIGAGSTAQLWWGPLGGVNVKIVSQVNGKNSLSLANEVLTVNEQVYPLSIGELETGSPACLFSASEMYRSAVQIYSFAISRSGTPQANYTPAISPDGVPCMYDSVSSTAKTNDGTGSFIVGMTAAQAVQLANLPTGGGELTVSLPQSILNDAGEITDAAVNAALNKAGDNGWDLTLQYYS